MLGWALNLGFAGSGAAASSDTGDWGSGGHGSQTGGAVHVIRRRRGRRGYLVNPWTIVRDWWRARGAF